MGHWGKGAYTAYAPCARWFNGRNHSLKVQKLIFECKLDATSYLGGFRLKIGLFDVLFLLIYVFWRGFLRHIVTNSMKNGG